MFKKLVAPLGVSVVVLSMFYAWFFLGMQMFQYIASVPWDLRILCVISYALAGGFTVLWVWDKLEEVVYDNRKHIEP